MDEQTVGHKGRWTTATFMNKSKRAGQGYKIFSVNQADSCYTMNFCIEDKKQSVDSITVKLVSGIPGTGYNIFLDNHFNKPEIVAGWGVVRPDPTPWLYEWSAHGGESEFKSTLSARLQR